MDSIDPLDYVDGEVANFAPFEDSGEAPFGYLSIMWANLNVQALLYLVPFNFSLAMLCWNYYLTMMTDPGSPPVDWNPNAAPTQEQIVLIIVDLCLDGCVLIGISLLTIYHIWCISNNTTTIESWEKDRVITMIRQGKIIDVKCPYNQGILANFQQVLGHNPLLWLWPQPMLGDGLRFKVRSDTAGDIHSDEDEGPSISPSFSRAAGSHLWWRPFDGTNNPRDEMVEMV
ncbi:Palmitoyltransferase [Mortierella sp. NVP85]|nr:Palmitoyltransferase [Mortierella sp. NVP85]